MPLLLRLQKVQGKSGGEGKEASLHRFSANQKIASSWKTYVFLPSYSTSNKLLLVARHTLITDLQKCL